MCEFLISSLSTMTTSMHSNLGFKAPFSALQGYGRVSPLRNGSRVSTHFYCLDKKKKGFSSNNEQLKVQRICSATSNGDASDVPNIDKSSADQEGAGEGTGDQQAQTFSFNEMMKRLRRYGISGMLSYGLLNTAYYLTTFLFVWFYVAPAPGRMGFVAAAQRFLKIMAMVWAGSQVTKLARVGGALALAPFVDRGLSWFTMKFKFQTQGNAFMTIVGGCFGLALLLFFTVTVLSA